MPIQALIFVLGMVVDSKRVAGYVFCGTKNRVSAPVAQIGLGQRPMESAFTKEIRPWIFE